MQDNVFEHLVAGASDVIQQAHSLLTPLHAHDYDRVVSPYYQSSVGQHMRHIIDAFQAVKTAVAESDDEAICCIDYEMRERGADIERCLESAKQRLTVLSDWLETLVPEQLEHACDVKQCLSPEAENTQTLPSFFAREIAFLITHTVHHFALMRSMLLVMDYPVAAHIGKANGTLAFEQLRPCAN